MIVLVVGSPDSGKSALAEEQAIVLAGDMQKKYIATMVPFGEEGKMRVARHRALRQGKGFDTIERDRGLDKLAQELAGQGPFVGLLECMSNLVGNEMYARENSLLTDKQLVEVVLKQVEALSRVSCHLVVVTNVFPLEEEGYDRETIRYVSLIASVNEGLRKMADKVYEKEKGEWISYENH